MPFSIHSQSMFSSIHIHHLHKRNQPPRSVYMTQIAVSFRCCLPLDMPHACLSDISLFSLYPHTEVLIFKTSSCNLYECEFHPARSYQSTVYAISGVTAAFCMFCPSTICLINVLGISTVA